MRSHSVLVRSWLLALVLFPLGHSAVFAQSPVPYRVVRHTEAFTYGYSDPFSILDFIYSYDDDGRLTRVRMLSVGGSNHDPESHSDLVVTYADTGTGSVTVTGLLDDEIILENSTALNPQRVYPSPVLQRNMVSPADGSMVYSAVLTYGPSDELFTRIWVFFGHGLEPPYIDSLEMMTVDGLIHAERVEQTPEIVTTRYYDADRRLLGSSTIGMNDAGRPTSIHLFNPEGVPIGEITYVYEDSASNYKVVIWPDLEFRSR
jgi:hypothetical protein